MKASFQLNRNSNSNSCLSLFLNEADNSTGGKMMGLPLVVILAQHDSNHSTNIVAVSQQMSFLSGNKPIYTA
jgi:hypothetical protein